MLSRNIDFVAVLLITLMMFGVKWVRSSHWQEAQDWIRMDAIRVVPAVQIERCPFTSDFFSRLTCILPH
jgi:hypothetical protein